MNSAKLPQYYIEAIQINCSDTKKEQAYYSIIFRIDYNLYGYDDGMEVVMFGDNVVFWSDGKSSGYHEAYSVYVGKQLDFLGEKYGLVNGMEATELQKKIDALRENGEIDKIKSEINDLNSTLRKAHQEGIDLYLVNEYNNKNKNYYEGGKSK